MSRKEWELLRDLDIDFEIDEMPEWWPLSAWLGHAPFAFWLMKVLQPRVFVELGTHKGYSYFAFCQAAKRLGLRTNGFAVDTWMGDDHTGPYSEIVYQQVNENNKVNYDSFSTLLRMKFDDAAPHFIEKSINLLHIDGFHTYEAVKHDFETWCPKVADNGIIIMHDTNIRDRGFGVYRLFSELKRMFPCFEFLHESGLGVVAKGGSLSRPLLELFSADEEDTEKIRRIFQLRGDFVHLRDFWEYEMEQRKTERQ